MPDYILSDTYWPQTNWYWPGTDGDDYWTIAGAPVVVVIPPISVLSRGPLQAEYYIILRDVNGNVVALFDSWRSLSITKKVNGIDSVVLIINGEDTRQALFELDGEVEIYRMVAGHIDDWYSELILLHRDADYIVDENGFESYVSISYGLNELLTRRIVGYRGGTIRADKLAPSETAMKEYVEENFVSATTGNGRLDDGVMLGFSVESDGAAGKVWGGNVSGKFVFDVLNDIASFAKIDFSVQKIGNRLWQFLTHENQLGEDRTQIGLNATTGLNSAGNVPVVFNVDLGNVSSISHKKLRSVEANSVFVFGKGQNSSQKVIVRNNLSAQADSPINRREVAKSGSSLDFEYQLNTLGDEWLEILQSKEEFDFEPLQTPQTLYGKHYFLGDKITIISRGQEFNKRIVGVSISVDGDKMSESLAFEVADLTQ